MLKILPNVVKLLSSCSSLNFLFFTKLKFSKVLVCFPMLLQVAMTFSSLHTWTCVVTYFPSLETLWISSILDLTWKIPNIFNRDTLEFHPFSTTIFITSFQVHFHVTFSVLFSKACFKRRTSHLPNLMQMR